MKRSRLRPVSRKKRDTFAARTKVIIRVHERDITCRFEHHCTMLGYSALDTVCSGPLDVHEIIPRSVYPGAELDVDNCVLLCRRHHEFVGDHPDIAHILGLHGFSWERAS